MFVMYLCVWVCKKTHWNGTECCSKYVCVRVFAVKTKEVKRWTSVTYIYACVRVRMRTKKYLAAKYVSARWLYVCISIYELMLTSTRSVVYWRIVNIPMSLGLGTYFCWLYVLPFSAACLKLCGANPWDRRASES